MSHVLVIGGTGMLADAVRGIARRGRQLTLLARSPAALAAEIGAAALAMDWTEEESVRAVLAALQPEPPFQAMISWIHPAGLWCLPDFERLLVPRGRSIRVHGSAAGDPGQGVKTDPEPPHDVLRQNVVLGWVNEPGGRRWLTDGEICRGVLAAFDDPQRLATIVGALR